MAAEKSNNKLVKQNLSENLCNLSCLKLSRVPVQAIKRNKCITILYLQRNHITRLGEDFATLCNIKKLDLSHNALICLPHNFGNLINLTSLSLYNNNLLHLPVSFGNLKNLYFLDLRDNAFEYELEVIIGTCESVEECEKCAHRVVQYIRNKFNRLNNMSNLKDFNQTDMVYHTKGDHNVKMDECSQSSSQSPDYIYTSETDDNCSEISISNMSLNSDTECEEEVTSIEVIKKTIYIKTEYRNHKVYETNTPRNSKDGGSDGSTEYVTVTESDDDSFKDVSSSETESNQSLQQTSHKVIVEKCADYAQNEDFCGNDNLVQCVKSGMQEIDELKIQTPVKMVQAYWFKMFLKCFLRILIVAFIFAAIYFICTLSLDFYSNKVLSNFTKTFNWNSPKLVCEENKIHSVESQIQEMYEEEQHSTTKIFRDKKFLDSGETPMATWFEKILYIFIIFSELI